MTETTKTRSARGARDTIRGRVLELARRREGVTHRGAVASTGLGATAVQTALRDLELAHRLTRRAPVGFDPRWFTTTAAADAWVASLHRPAPAQQPTKPGRLPRVPAVLTDVKPLTAATRKPVPLTVVAPKTPGPATAPAGDAIVPEGVKITRGPSWTHDPRFQVAPGERHHGAGFSRLGIGRYVESEAA